MKRDNSFVSASTAWKVSKHRVISGPYFPVFSPNTGKYGPDITPYFDIFYAALTKVQLILTASVLTGS